MNHSAYRIEKIEADRVFIVDLDQGGLSVTNDAEAVCQELAQNRGFASKRFIYRDSEGRWDELVHRAGVFQGFAPYDGPVPA